jgi:peroxiredoxin
MMRLIPGRIGWIIVIILFVLAGFLLWIDVNKWRTGQPTSGRAAVGAPAPDATVWTLDDKPARLAVFYRHPLVLNFFATWCVPCKAELPLLQRRYLELHRKGLLVVGVDQEEGATEVRAFVKRFGVTFPVVVDKGEGTLTYDIHAIPTSIFIDSSGIVRAIHVGELSASNLDADVAKILP